MADAPGRLARGHAAEELAASHLAALGMTILARNVRVSRLEIDIVARDGDAIVIVEVRSRGRGAWQRPLVSIGPRKQERIRNAAQSLWNNRFSRMAGIERLRFDVVAVDLNAGDSPQVEHIRAAFV